VQDTTAATPAQPKKKSQPKMYAVVREEIEHSTVVRTIEAPTMNDLKKQLSDPLIEVLAIFRGRQFQMQTKRQVSFL
jgi:hypothetical protein